MEKRESALIYGFILFSIIVSLFVSSIFYFFSVKATFVIDFLGTMIILFIIIRNFIVRYRNYSYENSFLKRLVFSIPNFLVLLNIFFILFFVIPYYIEMSSLNYFFIFLNIVSFIIFVLSILKFIFRKIDNDSKSN